MDRKGTNELISGEKSFIAILSNLRVYFVVRLPDYFQPSQFCVQIVAVMLFCSMLEINNVVLYYCIVVQF